MSDPHASATTPETPAATKSGLMPKLMVGGFVGLVIVVECAAAYFLLPSPDEVSANMQSASAADAHKGSEKAADAEHGAGEHGDESHAADSHAADSHAAGSSHGDDHEDGHGEGAHLAEVELGEFSITLLQPEAGLAYRVDFKIGATVDEHDKEKFAELFASCQQRFRDQVMVEVRNCELTDLTDSGLGLIKRRILEKSNSLFGEPLLSGVFFSEFSLVEQ